MGTSTIIINEELHKELIELLLSIDPLKINEKD